MLKANDRVVIERAFGSEIVPIVVGVEPVVVQELVVVERVLLGSRGVAFVEGGAWVPKQDTFQVQFGVVDGVLVMVQDGQGEIGNCHSCVPIAREIQRVCDEFRESCHEIGDDLKCVPGNILIRRGRPSLAEPNPSRCLQIQHIGVLVPPILVVFEV